MAEPDQRKCSFVIVKRGRTCRMMAAKGSVYCGEHLIHDKTQQRMRVSCPLDSSHSVYEDQLPKHLKRCNAAKKPVPSCYSRGINSGSVDDMSSEPLLPLSQYPEVKVQALIDKVDQAYQSHVTLNIIHEAVLKHPSLEDDLCDPNNGPSALKHLTQQSSILAHIDALGLLETRNVAYIEFGSGRGKMSECIQRAIELKLSNSDQLKSTQDNVEMLSVQKPSPQNLHFLLVDRSSCRRKVDGSLRTSSLVGVHYTRLLMDIEDLDLRAVEILGEKSNISHVVSVSKHLCGVATDLSLRCLVNGRFGTPKLSGILIALCCHHRCTWSGLVGKEMFTELGFTSAEFHMISHMTSWAVCGVRPEKTVDHVTSSCDHVTTTEDVETLKDTTKQAESSPRAKIGYLPHSNESIGLKCKRLIDFARLDYLRRQGFNAKLVYYVDRTTSLENVLLLAT